MPKPKKTKKFETKKLVEGLKSKRIRSAHNKLPKEERPIGNLMVNSFRMAPSFAKELFKAAPKKSKVKYLNKFRRFIKLPLSVVESWGEGRYTHLIEIDGEFFLCRIKK